ncbi:MAG TPA: carboxypeptidase-like regulatory domain-containing protein [Cyclobacteriaceae bacterium]|nr:carboxypeptidase-like regulatory domain-containing protein [Cyclobacteriaceae bacterium]
MFRFLCILLLTPFSLWAQEAQLKGHILGLSEQPLQSANVRIQNSSKGVSSDTNGDFIIRVNPGKTSLEITYTGYKKLVQKMDIKGDTLIVFRLEVKTEELDEVVVSSSRFRQSDQLQTTRMSSVTLSEKEINSIPVLGGEADLMKIIQLLPGVTKGVQGSTDLFVRGGAADQNLVLLDGAPVYNTGHLFGFLSVFNPDVLSSVESMNGAFPAEYGGRLSSILDVQTRTALPERTQVKGNIGLLASRLMIEQPLVKDKLSISLAGRRSYVDQVVRLAKQELPYHFYDLNAKMIFRPTKNDQVELTHYAGDDILNFIPGANTSNASRNATAVSILATHLKR